VLDVELFPHLGVNSSPKEKAIMLGYMLKKLLTTFITDQHRDEDWAKLEGKVHNDELYSHVEQSPP
jgi:hypothetical protein